ncbi:MAG: helix-turn-helix domain-containing protein [Mycobacteriales bacterium]
MAGDDDPDGTWLTPKQVAGILGVSLETVRRLARAGQLPHIKVGRALRFKRSVIENLDELPPD